MTADPHHTQQGPGRPLSACLAASTPLAGASRRPDPGSGPQNAAQGFRGEQDGPHAPQDGPQRPDAGAETPDGAGGRQTGADGRERCPIHDFRWHPGDDCDGCPIHPGDVPPITCTCQPAPDLARLRRLRTQLAAEHAKAVRADQHPRPDLDHLRVTPHNGIAAGLETALFFIDHHLREAGEQPARTTANNGAGSGDAVDNCCVCGGGPVVYRNFLERPFCWACADCQCGENPCVRTGINDPAVSGEAALRAALREALACLYTLTRVGGSVIGYQTVNVIPPAMYDRWQAVLQAVPLDGKEQP